MQCQGGFGPLCLLSLMQRKSMLAGARAATMCKSTPTCRRTCCRGGRENSCRQAVFTGDDRPGGFAQYTLAEQRYCFALLDAAILFAPGEIATVPVVYALGQAKQAIADLRAGKLDGAAVPVSALGA